MEVRTRGIPPTNDEDAAISSVLGVSIAREPHDATGGHRNRERRHLLLPALHAVNDRVGWLSQPAIDGIAERLDVSPAEVFGVASFYDLFAFAERTGRQVRVCVDLACRAADPDLVASLPAGSVASPCLGACERAPAALVIDPGEPVAQALVAPVRRPVVDQLLAGDVPPLESQPAAAVPQAGDANLVLLQRAGAGDPLDFATFVATGGFAALQSARAMGPEAVIDAVADSGLTGRGGAAFSTARKWSAVRTQTTSPHYMVCNADESEPGTFKDRTLIENDPFTLIESIAIACLAIDSTHAFIYLRGEYPRAFATLQRAIAVASDHPLLAGLTIELRKGAGAYICGEETAIFNSIEGYRGEPRNKPPFPFEVGLFGQPTAVNNVETLVNVPSIIAGAVAGTPRTANRRLLCVSGSVNRPGVYEVEMGLTLGDVIQLAGGVIAGSHVQAVLLGGAAGGFAGPGDMDLVLDPDATRSAGLTLGSGVVMVLDQHADLADQLVRVAEFFRHESCGQCVPCRVGTVRQHEAIERLTSERLTSDPNLTSTDVALLRDIGRAMQDASICGLGQTAFNAIETALDRLGMFAGDRL
ncbi:MAG TPA: NADH-ubiquinone oxidoreductase-F iron-sulfur binding region domain-containing protein [Ilumatobacter sp.]|nr:NADH-ubiquinone oxidoreductase-F iron-sulfur binding region domain-containing protein [Ilumatobacter sp.]